MRISYVSIHTTVRYCAVVQKLRDTCESSARFLSDTAGLSTAILCFGVEGSEHDSADVTLVNTGLTVTRYIPQLLAASGVDCVELNVASIDCNEAYLALQQSVAYIMVQ